MKKAKYIYLVLMIVLLFSCVACGDKATHEGELQAPINSSSVSGKYYEDVVKQFETAGFKDVSTREVPDLITGWMTKDGDVESVSINGDTDFSSSDWFPQDASVVVAYHTFPKKEENNASNTDADNVKNEDVNKTFVYQFDRYEIDILDYFKGNETSKSEDGVTFVVGNNYNEQIILQIHALELEMNEQSFINSKKEIFETMIDGFGIEGEIESYKDDITILDYPGMSGEFLHKMDDKIYNVKMVSFFDRETSKMVSLDFCYGSDSEKSSFDDLDMMIESIRVSTSDLEGTDLDILLSRPERNGWDDNSNQSVNVDIYSMNLPDYFVLNREEYGGNTKVYKTENELVKIQIEKLEYYELNLTSGEISDDSIKKAFDKHEGVQPFKEYILEEISDFSGIGNAKMCKRKTHAILDSGVEGIINAALIIDLDNEKCVYLYTFEQNEAEYSYTEDFNKIISSITQSSSKPEANISIDDEKESKKVTEKESAKDNKKESSSKESNYDKLDLSTKNAYKSGLNYLKYMAFSKKGLIEQLSSEYGDGYTLEQATNAVEAIEADGKVDWKEEAVKSAKNYLELTSFSRSGLIEQLTSEYGEQFTQEEAEYAVDQIGLN